MHRLIAVLVLLGSGWSQSSALDCAMGNPSDLTRAAGAVAEYGAAHHHEAARDRDADPSSSDPTGSHPSDSDCRLLMTCAAGVLAARKPSLSSAPRPSTTAQVASVDRGVATTFPTQEPPPPRLPA